MADRDDGVSVEATRTGGGVGFFALLGLLFIGLKLGGLIDWSWWLVLLPLYGPPACVALIVLLIVLAVVVATACGARWK